MNSLTMLQKCLVGICMTGGAGCLAVVLAISLKGLLRNECNRWQRLAFLKRVLCILVLTAAVLYAGTKPPSSGDVQEDASSGEATTTNEPPTHHVLVVPNTMH